MENKALNITPDKFETFGVMIDMSRNGVMKIDTLKKYVDILSKMGYNTIQLYTEDTYEVNNEPYFGYMRGCYTSKEIKEIDAYAIERGMELIPCIQTLAHVNQIFKWSEYWWINDCNDILLVGDERTYKLIDNIFSTLSDNFTSRKVNIGMDEAHMVGLGRYLDKHGYQNRYDIILRHLNKVCEIASKYGFAPMMWSDMFFRFVNHGEYYCESIDNTEMINEVKKNIPVNLSLIYWDYGTQGDKYDNMFKAHKQFSDKLFFAGGAESWSGFAPHNEFSIDAARQSIPAAIRNGVKNVFFTLWGDDGRECSPFSVLPALMCASEFARGNENIDIIKDRFLSITDVEFDDFLTLDLPNKIGKKNFGCQNPSKYMLYNDVFLGIFDSTVDECEAKRYKDYYLRLSAAAEKSGEFSYLFELNAALCKVLSLKYDIGVRTRRTYHNRDKNQMIKIVDDYDTITEYLTNFYSKVTKYWDIENKPFGFEVQDVRLGGLISRIKHCKKRLLDYINDRIEQIEELEIEVLDFTCKREETKTSIYHNKWSQEITNSIV